MWLIVPLVTLVRVKRISTHIHTHSGTCNGTTSSGSWSSVKRFTQNDPLYRVSACVGGREQHSRVFSSFSSFFFYISQHEFRKHVSPQDTQWNVMDARVHSDAQVVRGEKKLLSVKNVQAKIGDFTSTHTRVGGEGKEKKVKMRRDVKEEEQIRWCALMVSALYEGE